MFQYCVAVEVLIGIIKEFGTFEQFLDKIRITGILTLLS